MAEACVQDNTSGDVGAVGSGQDHVATRLGQQNRREKSWFVIFT